MAKLQSKTPIRSLVTPTTTEIPRRLSALMFGSYLFSGFRAIPEEEETRSIKEEIQLQSINKESKEPAMRRLQFSDAETSTQPTPNAAPIRDNRSAGKSLTFVPPCMKNSTVTVKIQENDIKDHVKYWETCALIGYVLGDIPHGKRMENYIAKLWSLVPSPKVLVHDEGYYIFQI